MITRDLQSVLAADFDRYDKMLFVAGPRQTGKTTLARMLMEKRPSSRYWNYDIPEDRLLLTRKPSFFKEIDRPRDVRPLVVFDELHKYRLWKSYLKGAFDDAHADFSFLVTGSGRLDLYRKGGDSLAGRYFLHRLFPLTIGELATAPRRSLEDFLAAPDELPAAGAASRDAWQAALHERAARRPEDRLRHRQKLARDPAGLLPRLFADPVARLENIVAVHLLRAVTAWTEAGAGEFSLHFVRDPASIPPSPCAPGRRADCR